ncbi:hypothetical protein VC83_07692 [Pseudogymnoascus destructans]|uniref:Ams2/SPT21 N-terminal domain-containing protein n=2 Tax=Pseudogymnoascus destructans TaxID=655981 RepID=L8FXA7_PSED2|nr:uncharacterized protein VC83_07692 [Pseudogymnoascus destructans]ELR05585.1 hypothetical protein GMDG_01776 [Pseudogymnoascus destructans 20631-21]OAF55664.2 hypothetical protein VC83_07692 [Pseudogymnoascus destructans]
MSSPPLTARGASSQPPMPPSRNQPGTTDGESAGVTIRSMRLKVLYTFDDQNKTNCLARWPHVLQIQAVAMDENATIGVIELKTCIQAIVQCSPELVAKLGQDYTVYAYDYSEYDNPLVGQGMLSWALAASLPTPEAPASQPRQLITGRVCKNIQGLFSNGVAETLEVKLRLVPVPTVLQSEYVRSMETYREISKAMPVGFDHGEWLAFLQSNPSVGQVANRVNTPVPMPSQRSGISMEVVNQLLSPSLQQTSVDPFNVPPNMEMAGSISRPPSPREKAPSRPASQASVKRPRKPRAPSKPLVGGNTSGYEDGTDGEEAPTTKKRAKITQTNWNSKSSFGTGTDSLRVAASTAGSLRLFRPIAIAPAPGGAAGSHLQEMPRAPTPVPQLPSLKANRSRATSQSMLRRNSIVSQFGESRRQYNSPYPPSDAGHDPQDHVRMSIESDMTSPEKEDSPADTPPDINSSPPVLRRTASARSSPHAPSSPILPPMPRTDSGFMSGDISELFEDNEEGQPAEEDPVIAAKYTRRRATKPAAPRAEKVHHGFAIEEVTPGPPELLPTKMLPRAEAKQKAGPKPKMKRTLARSKSTMSEDGLANGGRMGSVASFAPVRPGSAMAQVPITAAPDASQSVEQSQTEVAPPSLSRNNSAPQNNSFSRPPSRSMSRTASLGSLTLPAVAASEPALPPSSLQHAHTWSDAAHPATEAPTQMDDGTVAEPYSKRSAMGKKQTIRLRLEDAISRGEMPPFCSNCGAIETPAWRKAWAQECKGDPGYHEYSDEAGRVTAIEIVERDEGGKPVAYRLIKKSLAAADDKSAFTEILMCNPCGIWMSKYKSQRPEDRWGKDPNQNAGEKKKRGGSKPRKSVAGQAPLPTSEAHFYSDAPVPPDNYTSAPAPQQDLHVSAVTTMQSRISQRGGSVQPPKNTTSLKDTAAASLRRVIQSSPARWMGTSRHTPIELEDELGATRRLLFPSPRKDDSPKSLSDLPPGFSAPNCNKENHPPAPNPLDDDDDLAALFGEDPLRTSRPTTPTRLPPSNPFKTPTRPTPSHRPITRSISRSAKSARSRRGAMLPERTPTRSTPATRRSPRHRTGGVQESPFTATLNRLISETGEDGHANGGYDTGRSPSRNLDLGLDFSALPDLAHPPDLHSDALLFAGARFGHGGGFGGGGGAGEFFSTDAAPMPSSPPRMFELYEDPLGMEMGSLEAMEEAMWREFGGDGLGMGLSGGGGGGLVVDRGGRASFSMRMDATVGGDGGVAIKVEDGEGAQAV